MSSYGIRQKFHMIPRPPNVPPIILHIPLITSKLEEYKTEILQLFQKRANSGQVKKEKLCGLHTNIC